MNETSVPPEELPPELERQYDPDEVFTFEGTLEDLADALFKDAP